MATRRQGKRTKGFFRYFVKRCKWHRVVYSLVNKIGRQSRKGRNNALEISSKRERTISLPQSFFWRESITTVLDQLKLVDETPAYVFDRV
jgi:hypothetical protein